ncbi:MAG: S8 family serine peptidase [Cyanobacteria bacterium P01_E01_bin.42]
MLLSLQLLQRLFIKPAKEKKNKKRKKSKGDRFLQSLVLEPILTPSALLDAPNDPNDDLDVGGDDGDVDAIADDSGDDATAADDATPLAPASPDGYEVSPWITADDVEYPGTFIVGDTGEVGVDFLFDGGAYRGEVAIFSVEGMEDLEIGSQEFIRIAAERALSDSELGHVVIQDVTEGAKFSNASYWEGDFNSGDYQGVKTVTMNSGDRFAIMLVPDGTVQQVFDDPDIGGNKTPLFSLDYANPEDGTYMTRMTDVTGDGNTFAMEDWRLDANSDRDYNDVVFQIRGAQGDAPLMDDMVDSARDWRNEDFGQALVSYARAYTEGTDYEPLQTDFTTSDQPLVGVIDTGFSGDNPDIDYSRIITGSDFIDGDRDPFLAAGEGNEHGTHVLGIIGATQGNGIGIDGINDDAPIWLGRAVGSGKWAESLIEFVDAAAESGQPNAVVNLSMDLTQIDADGNVTTRYELTPGERAAIEYARQNDVLIVVSSGNDNGVMSALGQASQEFDNIITVGAADGVERAEYSSYGYGLDLVAEGGTVENGVLSTTGDGVGTMAGSSVAAAKVTGAASQVWAANPELSFTQVKQILKDTAIDLNTPNWDKETGSGLLNIAAAVSVAKITKPEAHYSPSSLIPETWSGEGKVTPGDRAVNFIYSIQNESFSGTVAPIAPQYGNGVAYRHSPRLNDRVGQYQAAVSNSPLNFDAWTYGERVPDWWAGTADELWYRIAGTNHWVPSAYINGYPGSNPPVLKPSNTSNPDPDPPPTNPSLANPILSTQGAGYFTARPQYYTSGNIFALSMYGSSLVSGRGYTEGNCTWYAHGRVLELGGNRAALQSMRGNANQWHQQISNGTQIVSSPQVGDIAQWTSNGANHVAVVEKVNDNGTIVISESHWKSEYSGSTYLGRNNGTLHNVRTISASNPDRFIRVPGVQVQNGTPANPAGTFTGRVIATIGANLRDDPTTASAKVGSANYGAVLTFDKVATGEFISYPGLGTATGQWYRIAGTDNWISAAIVNGSPGSSSNARSAKPGEEIKYMIKPGDTLWDIARRYLGDGRRWTEIKKADGSTFTSEEARRLQIGQCVYIPVRYQQGTGKPVNPGPDPTPVQNIVLKPTTSNLTFSRGQEWVTSTGYKFVFQHDGNLVMYNPQGQATWATGTNGTSADVFAVQKDGNVVLYDNGKAVWATDTAGHVGAYFAIQGDGNLVVYSSANKPLFDSGTHSGNTGTFTASPDWLNKHNPNIQYYNDSQTDYHTKLNALSDFKEMARLMLGNVYFTATGGYLHDYSHLTQYYHGYKAFHAGFDIGTNNGNEAYALIGGTVERVTNLGAYVYNSTLNKTIFYGHVINKSLYVGQQISAGTKLGTITDGHLHFHVRDGRNSTWVDPTQGNLTKTNGALVRERVKNQTLNPLNVFLEAKAKGLTK